MPDHDPRTKEEAALYAGIQSGRMVVVGHAAIFTLLEAAATKMAFPRIRYKLPDGVTIGLYIAGEKSKYRGQIQITDNKQSFADRTWYGRIEKTQDGKSAIIHYSYAAYKDKAIAELIAQIADNPLAVAVLQGKELKWCCFCGKGLTNKVSRHVGYGPICAETYGLPWDITGVEDTDIDGNTRKDVEPQA